MIPHDLITEWRAHAPWPTDAQVEQDLVISRAIVSLFSQPDIAGLLAFRGGTALHKVFLSPAARYSEDIDLVQVRPGPIGEAVDAIRRALDPWLGIPRRTTKEGGTTLVWRTQSEGLPQVPMRLKVEINSREHAVVFGLQEREFTVQSRWWSGNAQVVTYAIDELLGTKLRALYQRKKGRDLFDLHHASRSATVSPQRVVECLGRYLEQQGRRVSRAEFERNLSLKLEDEVFHADVAPLLAPGIDWDSRAAAEYVLGELAPRLPGSPWQGPG